MSTTTLQENGHELRAKRAVLLGRDRAGMERAGQIAPEGPDLSGIRRSNLHLVSLQPPTTGRAQDSLPSAYALVAEQRDPK